jgi:LysR family hydrogen peroxide-inducible transcriptional activator
MNFQQLEYISAIHQHKHFGKAAEHCNVTQATLSAMVKKLEEELGVVLFDRSKKPVITTADGLKVLALAQKGIELKHQLEQFSNQDGGTVEGELKIGIIPTIASSLLPIILPIIIEKFPQLQLKITEATTEEILERIHLDQLDVGLLATPTESKNLEEIICYYEPMMLYGVKDKEKNYVTGKDVSNKNIWLLDEGNCFRNQTMSVCQIKEKDISKLPFSFAGSSFDTLLNLTDAFGGYTLIPELYYQKLNKKRRKISRSFIKPIPVREISLVYQRPYAKASTIKALANIITTQIASRMSSSELKPKDLSVIGI